MNYSYCTAEKSIYGVKRRGYINKMLPGMEEEEERHEDLTLGLLLDSYPQVGTDYILIKN